MENGGKRIRGEDFIPETRESIDRMENGGKRIRGEDVISKLKDDGDFDKLRLKIVRKLKQNEELRNTIIATVKQSATLNRPDAEHMKPRQLSDAIHQEVGDKVMGVISDDLWNTIRSENDIHSEIIQTVESVYNELLNPPEQNESHIAQNGVETSSNGHTDAKPTEPPPGFGRLGSIKNAEEEPAREQETGCSMHSLVPDGIDMGAPPPGFAIVSKEMNRKDVNDEDPDVPPGFG